MVKVRIQRFDPREDKNPRSEEFEVPFVKGMKMLDILKEIKSNSDSSLAFRYECKKATCGSCAVVVNGDSVLACKTPVEPNKEYVIAPLKNLPVVKDLVVDLSGVYNDLARTKPYLVCSEKWNGELSRKDVDATRQLRKCIECFICVSEKPNNNCSVLNLVKLARFNADVRDTENRLKLALSEGVLSAKDLERCTKLCPQGIDIKDTVEKLQAGAKNKA